MQTVKPDPLGVVGAGVLRRGLQLDYLSVYENLRAVWSGGCQFSSTSTPRLQNHIHFSPRHKQVAL
jgi:hypothetical protein